MSPLRLNTEGATATPRPPGIAWIGAGNMGNTLLSAAVATETIIPSDVLVIELDKTRREEMADRGFPVSPLAGEARNCEFIIFAVKPQSFPDVARALAPLPKSTLVISMMAGISSARIRTALGDHARVVRIMPNTPARISEGMTAVALGAGAVDGDEAFAMQLVAPIGETIFIDESLMNAATAVSGSGPAYLFLFAEAMQAAAQSLGFSTEESKLLVNQTLLGAARLLDEPGQSAADLRKSVTSKGGTTEAALAEFERAGFQDIIKSALTAARDRGAALDQ